MNARLLTERFLLISGLLTFVLGLGMISPYMFSEYAATGIMLGAVLLSAAFIVHATTDYLGTNIEKSYISLICLSILLVSAAIVFLLVVTINTHPGIAILPKDSISDRALDQGRPVPLEGELGEHPQLISVLLITIIRNYSGVSAVLAGFGIILLITGLYMKSKIG